MKKGVKIALVGRPNVGKSTLFNRIVEKRVAIVGEEEGTTRDRLYGEATLFAQPFQVIDTGGIDARGEIPFAEKIQEQAECAIREADGIVMVVDARVGVTVMDEAVVQILRRSHKPICLAVNKVDDSSKEGAILPFYALGIQVIHPISALHGHRLVELLERVLALSSQSAEERACGPSLRVAIIGSPNVGKSTLINALLGQTRCIVSPLAGTTRDAIDVSIPSGENGLSLIDTAGIRRKKSHRQAVDKFAAMRTTWAIERSDISLLLIDATAGISTQDKKIARQVEKAGKGCILLLNKWDLVRGRQMEHYAKDLRNALPFSLHCPILFTSGKRGRNLEKIPLLAREVYNSLCRRIPTAQLNAFIAEIVRKRPPPRLRGKGLRIYYMTQIDVLPPRFLLFVNRISLVQESYKSYIANRFRTTYRFPGTPLIFSFKEKIERKR